jgi:hypothetical protein
MASKPRSTATPTELLPLSDVITSGPEDQAPAPGFEARLRGEGVEVTAVLQRTVVVAPLGDRWADKQVVRHADLLVDPALIGWRPKVAGTGFPMKRRRYTAGQREEMREASDRRARADQARQAAAETAAREIAAQQRATSATLPSAGPTAARPLAATASSRPIATFTPSSAAPDARQRERGLPAELRQARRRIAELEAELERHRAVALDVVRRVEVVLGRRAA